MPKIYNREYNKETRSDLRNHQTKYEKLLWGKLKGKQLNGYKFNRQFGIDRYILDFYCPQSKLAIELDGNQHYLEENVKYDKIRTDFLNALEIRVLRFRNIDVKENMEVVIIRIKKEL